MKTILENSNKLFKHNDENSYYSFAHNIVYACIKSVLKDKPIHNAGNYLWAGNNERKLIYPTSTRDVFYRELIVMLSQCSVMHLPAMYANHLRKTNQYDVKPTMWGNKEYVYSTEHLIAMDGKKLKKKRNGVSRLRENKRFTIFTYDDFPERRQCFIDLVAVWRRQLEFKGAKIYTNGYFETMLEIYPTLRECLSNLHLVGLWDKDENRIVACNLGVQYSDKYWCSVFGYADRDSEDYTADYVWSEIAKLFKAFPYEIDGGGVNSGDTNLMFYKNRYLTDEVIPLQIAHYMVSKKARKK